MAKGKPYCKEDCGRVFPIQGEQDERQTRRNGQHENDPNINNSKIVQTPANVINHHTNNRSYHQR